jgi:GTP-binding protein
MIPADSEDHFKEYQILYKELEEYNPELIDKDIIVSISKSDLLDDELKKEITAEFPEKLKPLFFSGVTQEGLVELKDVIWKNYTDKKHKAFIFERFFHLFLKDYLCQIIRGIL